MTKKLLFLFAFLCAFSAYPQVAFYDALTIVNKSRPVVIKVGEESGKVEIKFQKENFQEQLNILSFYIPADSLKKINTIEDADTTEQNEKKYAILKNCLKDNPFITLPATVQSFPASLKKLSGKAIKGLKGIDVTNFSDALAQFMIERAKEELNVAFFQKFKAYVEKHPEIQTLFPETTTFLGNMMAHEYTQLINGLRDSFHDDLKNLIYNLDDLFLLPRFEKVVHDFPEIPVVIRSIQIISDLEDSKHPSEIIKDLKEIKEWDSVKREEVKNVRNLLRTSGLFSDAMRFEKGNFTLDSSFEAQIKQIQSKLVRITGNDTLILKSWNGERSWITSRHFDILYKNTVGLKVFLGLVYQRALVDDIKFYLMDQKEPLAFTELMRKQSRNLFLFRSYFFDFQKMAEKVDESLAIIKSGEEINNEVLTTYIGTSIDVVEYGFRVVNLFDKKIDGCEYIEIARTGNNLYRNLFEKDYASAITNAMTIIDKLTESVSKKSEVQVKIDIDAIQKNALLADSTKKKSIREVKVSHQNFCELNKVSKGALKYGVFMANIIDADGPDEIKQAISNAALPVGSSSYKKYQGFTLSINSYLGAQVRLEKVTKVQRAWDQTIGLMAPVGLALNHGLCKGKGGSVSLFAPLIDIGAIVDFRLKSDSALTDNIQLGNIFSPGAYFVYGFGANIPLALGIGGQYGPGLRKLELDGNNGTKNVYHEPEWRLNIFLAVDIPLFNLTRGKKLGSR
jgi:hypothetical protein